MYTRWFSAIITISFLYNFSYAYSADRQKGKELVLSVIDGDAEKVKNLLQQKVDPNPYFSPSELLDFTQEELKSVSNNTINALLAAVVDENELIINILLNPESYGISAIPANIDSKNNEENTALLWALENNKNDTALFLIGHGASPNVSNIYGKNALMLAAINLTTDEEPSKKIIRLLIGKKADRNATDTFGNTALVYALLSFAKKGIQPVDIVQGLTTKNNINTKNAFSLTPLIIAAAAGLDKVVEFLLGQGASISEKAIIAGEERNALEAAAYYLESVKKAKESAPNKKKIEEYEKTVALLKEKTTQESGGQLLQSLQLLSNQLQALAHTLSSK